jgi:predicted MFS family arabinose efflux permease
MGSFLGAWLGGKIYDMTGNYDLMWNINLAAGLGAFLIHLIIREKPIPFPIAKPA